MVNHAQAIKRLSVNRDDLLIMSQVPQDMALEFLPFLNNPIVAVARPDHPLAALASLSLQDLTGFPLIVREPGSGTRKACEEYCHEKRAHFAQRMELGSLESQREAVLAGLGLALLPRHAVSHELSSGRLCELPVQELPLYRSWCAVHPRGKRLSPVAQAFIAFIRNQRGLTNSWPNASALGPQLRVEVETGQPLRIITEPYTAGAVHCAPRWHGEIAMRVLSCCSLCLRATEGLKAWVMTGFPLRYSGTPS